MWTDDKSDLRRHAEVLAGTLISGNNISAIAGMMFPGGTR
jgi:hypothetical protein